MSEDNPGYTKCIECKKDIHEKVARRWTIMTESGPMKCAQCHESPGFIAWWSCPKCGNYCCGDKCAVEHAENCQKLPGYTCKLCGENFGGLYDFTKHATTCVRPSDIPDDISFHCPKCGLSFVSTSEVVRHTQSCQGVPPTPKVGGSYGLPTDCHAWFSLRSKPTDEESKALDIVRREYGVLMRVLLNKLPSNPDSTVAIRQLKESMQTAISSIVCADVWQTPKGD